jgi:rod shape-determining protein MreB
MPFFARKMAIDLGSANTLVYLKGSGVILDEPAVVAINYWDKKAIAVGTEAKGFMGRTPQHIKAFRPLKAGFMVDGPSTQHMLAEFYLKIFGKKSMKSKAIFVVPTAITPEEKKALRAVAAEVGCVKVSFLAEAMAAALGAGIDPRENRARIIINIGGNICEIAVVINATVTFSRITSFAGDAVDDAIIKHLKESYGVHIGENMAEKCKKAIGAALSQDFAPFLLTGKDMQTNGPRPVSVEARALQQAIMEPLEVLEKFLAESLAKIAAQHRKEAREDGVLLVGGGSLLPGLDFYLSEKLGIRIHRDSEPLRTAIKGAGLALEKRRKYRKLFMKK